MEWARLDAKWRLAYNRRQTTARRRTNTPSHHYKSEPKLVVERPDFCNPLLGSSPSSQPTIRSGRWTAHGKNFRSSLMCVTRRTRQHDHLLDCQRMPLRQDALHVVPLSTTVLCTCVRVVGEWLNSKANSEAQASPAHHFSSSHDPGSLLSTCVI